VLREQVAGLAILQNSIRKLMGETHKIYRRSVPPTRLALTVRKEGPPRSRYTLSWQLIARKPTEFDHVRRSVDQGRKFRRWLHPLKIADLREFGRIVFWNGLHDHRKVLIRFYERAKSLNEAHRVISRRLASSRRSASHWRNLAKGLKDIPKPDVVDPIYDHLTPASGEVLEGAWLIRWIIELELKTLEGLPVLPCGIRPQLRISRQPAEILRFEWGTEGGATYPTLRKAYSRFKKNHPPGTELPPRVSRADREKARRIDDRLKKLGRLLVEQASAFLKAGELLAASESTGLDLQNLPPYEAFRVRRRLT
jgi:hypothetical protein